ncbi:hypothetical protein PSTT_15184 [Puccinia striiformis]|uniref:Serine/threonine specific protein phosphatases domain-containing protein n=1 Tax=Puccinia striiformis TaxID=27350 RepID=A0A2S4UIZ7_9BASI|nr:hypothetical protein PSTT_15184 [Puccinia striiformis]
MVIKLIDRKQEVPHDGAISDDIEGWGLSPRGAGYLFGGDIAKAFSHENDLDLIVVSSIVMEGYKLMFDDSIVTVWSAPNYCYRCGNVASILQLDEHLHSVYQVFEAAPQDPRGVPAKTASLSYFL